MNDWQEIRLGDICDVRDGTHDSPKQHMNGYPLITSKNLKSGVINFKNTYLISKSDFQKINKRSKVDRYDILYSMIGTIGEIAIVKSEVPFAIKNVGLFKCSGNFELAKWIYYYMQSSAAQEELLAAQKGSTQSYIALGDLRKFPILLPPLPEQRTITAVLSSLDDKIDLLHRQNKTLEAIAEALLTHWFINEGDEGWKEGKLNDIINIQSGFAFKSENFTETGQYKLVTIKAVQDGYLDLNNADGIAQMPIRMPMYCLLKEKDILLSLTGNVGRCCIVDKPTLLLNQRVAKLHPINEKDRAFSYFYFRLSNTRRQLEEMAKGTAQANLSPLETGNIQIRKPSRSSFDKFSDTVTPLFDKLVQNKKMISSLESLRDTLLPKLMSGEVRVEV